MQAMFAAIVVAVLAVSPASSAQDEQAKSKATRLAFEHYEQVRAALANDRLADVAPHAKALVPAAEAIGGAKARAASEQLAAAKEIEDARNHFGDLSDVLVPLFQAERIQGVHAYVCSMKGKSWVQRGDKIANPYYGKAMLACGSALPDRKK